MNTLVISELLLVAAALGLGLPRFRRDPGYCLAALAIGWAATLGAMRFGGLPVQPELHGLFSAMAAAAALPLLAVTVAWPAGEVARSWRYAGIFFVLAAVVAMVVVTLNSQRHWAVALALSSALVAGGVGLWRRQSRQALGGALLLAALHAPGFQWTLPPLLPADLLHLGLAGSLWLLRPLPSPAGD